MSAGARSLLLVAALLVAALALAFHDLSGANRPHELTKTPLVAVLGAVSTVVGARLVVRAWRARAHGSGSRRAWITLGLALLGSVASLLVLVGAALVLRQW